MNDLPGTWTGYGCGTATFTGYGRSTSKDPKKMMRMREFRSQIHLCFCGALWRLSVLTWHMDWIWFLFDDMHWHWHLNVFFDGVRLWYGDMFHDWIWLEYKKIGFIFWFGWEKF